VIASTFGLVWRLRHGRRLGPDLGFASQPLAELDLARACPERYPSSRLIAPKELRAATEGLISEELGRINAWAMALDYELHRNHSLRPRGTVFTTFGLAWVDRRIQLGVIHYLHVNKAFRTRPPDNIELEGNVFPVLVRPWLQRSHTSEAGVGGTCWVTVEEGNRGRCPAILTARHAVLPKGAAVGGPVRLDVSRPEPTGHLRRVSACMDAAVVEVQQLKWRGGERVSPPSVVGLKPIRLVTGESVVDGDVVEFGGVHGGTIPAQLGVEPETPVQFILNRRLKRGDSGCTGFDLEPEQYGIQAPPYLMYLGVKSLGFGGVTGYGQMLEQTRRVWDLHFHV
jgi:hypothetical protein